MASTRFFLVILLFAATSANGQIRFVCPLPGGIMQVRGGAAHCHIRANLSSDINGVAFRLGSDFDTTSPTKGWFNITISNGVVDTFLTVPISPHHYTLAWRTHGSRDSTSTITDLTPGHVIGIAGQSNADGTSWDMIQTPDGDIRMLRDDPYWKPAHEPVGHSGGGPWIAMANELWAKLNDTLPIGLVNVAVGGTGIVDNGPSGKWERNPNHPIDSSYYGNAVRKFQQAGGELEALCWIQGESDGSHLDSAGQYRSAFKVLMDGFHQDIPDTFPIYHLQISGNSGNFAIPASLPLVREAQHFLPPSILVGTAAGRSLNSDGLHFSVPTCYAVGHMFAGALLHDRYSISNNYYPPLTPDTIAYFDSITDGTILGTRCFALNWKRGGKPVTLANVHGSQFFTVSKDGVELDTSVCWFRISPQTGKTLIGIRTDSITLDHVWAINYVSTAGAELAPLANITGGDTVFATAFYGLPVTATKPLAGVTEFNVLNLVPNPTNGGIHCEVLSTKSQTLRIELRDNRGVLITSKDAQVSEGGNSIVLPTAGLAGGNYWIVITSKGHQSLQKMVLLQ